MNLIPKRGPGFHALAVLAFALLIVSVAFIVVGSNCPWWTILDITSTQAIVNGPFNLDGEQVRLFIEAGLEKLDLRFHVHNLGMQRGFYPRTDSYLWGILSHRCPAQFGTACTNRENVSFLSGLAYSLLSLSTLTLTATIGMMVLSASPVVNLKTTMTFYGISLASALAGLLIFEMRLRELFENPDSWAIFDEQIHTSFAGIDALQSIPKGASYKVGFGISRCLVWVGFVAAILSFLCFIGRVIVTKRSKKYLYSTYTLFQSRPSVFFSEIFSNTGTEVPKQSTLDSL